MTILSRRISYLFFAYAAVAILPCYKAEAQLLIRTILSNPFDAGSPGSTLANPLGSVIQDRKPLCFTSAGIVSIGASSDATLHTSKTGVGVIDNLNDEDSFVNGWQRLGSKSSSAVLSYGQLWQRGTVDSTESRTTILAGEDYDNTEVSVLKNYTQGSSISLTSDQPNYHFSGASSVVDGIFDIYPMNPLIHIDSTSQDESVNWISSIWKDNQAGLSISSEKTDGSVSLEASGSPARISIPISDQGISATASGHIRLTSRYDLTGFVEKSSLDGEGTISRETGMAAGSSTASERTGSGGISLAIPDNGWRAAQIFYERSIDKWGVLGRVTSAQEIGLPYSDVSGLGFSASYDIRANVVGINCQRTYSRHSRLDLEYRYIMLSAAENYGYQASLIIIPLGKSGANNQSDERGHLISGNYQFPVGTSFVTLYASQLIPVQSSSEGGGGGTGIAGLSSGGGNRTTTGGTSVAIELSVPIP